jgi:hypothetical protein
MEDSGQLYVPVALPLVHWIGSWVEPRDELEASGKEKLISPAGNGALALQAVAYCYADLDDCAYLYTFMVI